MPAEVTRCMDCGAPLKGVPSWLATAKVNFSCSNCPKKPARAARIEPVAELPALLSADPELADIVLDEDIDEEAEIEILPEEIEDDVKIE
jgi:hypothetical protein